MIKAGFNYKFEAGVDPASAEDENLQKRRHLVSVPFQSNTNFNTGLFNRTQEVPKIQPVVPLHIKQWLESDLAHIAPLISQTSPLFDNSTNGIGDVTEELFFSPTHLGPLIWSIGPLFTMLSANAPTLGTGTVLLGLRPSSSFYAGTLGDRCGGQQSVVGRRRSVATGGERLSRSAVHQQQHGTRLVLDHLTRTWMRLRMLLVIFALSLRALDSILRPFGRLLLTVVPFD
jgi:hypothetical protein